MLVDAAANPGWTPAATQPDPLSLRVAFDNGTRTVVFTATLGADGTIAADVTEPVIVAGATPNDPSAATSLLGRRPVRIGRRPVRIRRRLVRIDDDDDSYDDSDDDRTNRTSTKAPRTMTDIDPLLGRTLPPPSGPPQPPFVPSATTELPARATARTTRAQPHHPTSSTPSGDRRADRRCRARRHDDVRARSL